MVDHPESLLLEKGLPCWECTSSDAVARYMDEDGTRERFHCFSCGRTKFDKPSGGAAHKSSPKERPAVSAELQEVIDSGQVRAIPTRFLTQVSCQKWDYLVRNTSKGWQQLAVYRTKDGRPVGVKVRPASSKDDIFWIGTSKDQLFGRHLWGSGGKKVVITEGEIDAITVSQAQDHQWPVVSLPNGASNAAKAIAANLEWLCTFDQVCLGFDMDVPGRDACMEAAALLPPGKAFIVKWTEKDANAMLQEGKAADITRCIWQAEAYRPDGILDARTLSAACRVPPTMGVPWAYRDMTNWTLGRRGGEVYTFGAGFGLGKSDFLGEQISCTIMGETREGERFAPEGFALFSYESGAVATKMALAGKVAKRRFQFPQGHPDCMWTEADLDAVLAKMDGPIWDTGGKLFILDSKGAADWEKSKDLARFLHHAEGITNFMWDPIGALVVDEDEERRFLDRMTLEAAQLSVELNSKVYLVSHLTRPKEGPSHEEGGQVRGSQFRGANGIGMYSNFIFGLERNQQADTETERCTTTLRAVKDRLTGNCTGNTMKLFYDRISGTLDPEQLEPEGMTDEDRALI